MPMQGHEVKFYERDADVIETVARYILDGLGSGGRALVVATPEHRAWLDQALTERGGQLEHVRSDGSFVTLDAAETMRGFMVGGSPDPDLFETQIGGLLDTMGGTGSQIWVYGEMVALLCAEGNVAGAVELESRWNDLGAHATSPCSAATPHRFWAQLASSNYDWLAAFAARKTAPKGSAAFIARVLTEHPEVVASVAGSQLAVEWFGLTHTGYGYGNGWSALVDKATDARAQVIALGRLLASLEKGTDRQSWRRVMPATADYLAFIAANGYDLSEVEKRAAGLSKPKPARRTRATKAVSTSAPTADGAGTAAMHDQDVTATEADDQDAAARPADDTSAA